MTRVRAFESILFILLFRCKKNKQNKEEKFETGRISNRYTNYK